MIRALERHNLRPAAVVGVSMGAVVAATYAHGDDWYQALLDMDVSAFPGPMVPSDEEENGFLTSPRHVPAYIRMMKQMVMGWGPGMDARPAGLEELRKLLDGRNLDEGRIPIAISATDLPAGGGQSCGARASFLREAESRSHRQLGTLLGYGSMFSSLGRSGAGLPSVLGNTGPILLVILGVFALGEPLAGRKLEAAFLGTAAVVLIAHPSVTDPGLTGGAILLSLGAAGGVRVATVLLKRLRVGDRLLAVTA